MNDSIRLGRLFGIPIGVNWTIAALAIAFTFSLAIQGLPLAVPSASLSLRLAVSALAIAIFFVSILTHELGHALVAKAHGMSVTGITLWLLGGVTKLDDSTPTARAEFQVAVAGPAMSFLLGLFFGAVAIIGASVTSSRIVVVTLVWLSGINFLLAVFNLLPAAPLDGGRVLTAILWRSSGDPESARVISGRCGLILGGLLVVAGSIQVIALGQLGGWVTAAVGVFSFVAARSEISSAVIRRRLSSTTAADVAAYHPPSVPDTVTLTQLEAWAGPDGQFTAFPVTRWGPHPIGYVIPSSGGDLPEAQRSWTIVKELMRPVDRVAFVKPDSSIDQVINFWDGVDDQIAVVVDQRSGQNLATITGRQLKPLLVPPDLWGRSRTDEPPRTPPVHAHANP